MIKTTNKRSIAIRKLGSIFHVSLRDFCGYIQVKKHRVCCLEFVYEPTELQKDFIVKAEILSGKKFEGETRKDAVEYIKQFFKDSIGIACKYDNRELQKQKILAYEDYLEQEKGNRHIKRKKY